MKAIQCRLLEKIAHSPAYERRLKDEAAKYISELERRIDAIEKVADRACNSGAHAAREYGLEILEIAQSIGPIDA